MLTLFQALSPKEGRWFKLFHADALSLTAGAASRQVSATGWDIAPSIVRGRVITAPFAGLPAAGFYWLARLADRMAG